MESRIKDNLHAKGLPSLPPEDDEGNVEYKLKLVSPTASRFEHLVTQLKWRLREGQGEAIYEIGVEDSGLMAGLSPHELDSSLSTLQKMADRLGATVTILRERCVYDDAEGSSLRKVAEVLIRNMPENQEFIDLRIAVLGSADAGKSTLLGVITQGEMDNGRGRARLNLFRHLHEIQTGRTSSISLDIVGFDSAGEMITHQTHSVEEMLAQSSKLITFIDLAGHQKYLKTTIFGLTGYRPHFALLVVAANMGVVGTTREHLGLAMALEVPIFVVVTKIDLVTQQVLQRTLAQLESLVKGPGCNRIPVPILSKDDAINTAKNFNVEQNVIPLFVLSSVSGVNLDLLVEFLNVLPALQTHNEQLHLMQEYAEFRVDEVFNINNVGVVAAGLLPRGTIRENDEMLLGPSPTGEFLPVRIESIHRNKTPCRIVQAGQAASLSFGNLGDIVLRKGMAVVDPRVKPQACHRFEADVFLLYHPVSCVCEGFQTTVHIGNVCQTAIIECIETNDRSIRLNEAAKITFRFLNFSEYIRQDSRILFREGRTKGIGHVIRVLE